MTDASDVRLETLQREVALLQARLDDAESLSSALHGAPDNRHILESVPGGIVHVSGVGHILYANTTAQQILGLSFDELSERYVSDFQGETFFEDGSVCPVEDYPVSRCLVTGEPQPSTMIGVRQPSGEIVWALFTAIPTPPVDGRTGAVVSFVDVTGWHRARSDQRRFEERMIQVQKLEAVGRLAAGVAHDMGNVLATISGVASAIESESALDAVSRHDLELIQANCRRGRALIQDLMGFSRRGQFELRPININDVCREVESLLSRTLSRRIRLSTDLQGDLAIVEGDADQLCHALTNLCINASDAIEGPGDITISTRNHIADADHDPAGLVDGRPYVRLTVEDNGSGMPEDVLRQVLEPFFTTKPKGAGTGLGLSMVYGTVRKHNGELTITSEPRLGTRVVIDLPASEPEVPARIEPEPARSAMPKPRPVLVIAHSPRELRTHWKVLRQLGGEVHIAGTAESALETCRKNHDRLFSALIDAKMPPEGGEALARKLTAICPGLHIVQMIDEGASAPESFGHLVKPLTPGTVVEALQLAMEALPN